MGAGKNWSIHYIFAICNALIADLNEDVPGYLPKFISDGGQWFSNDTDLVGVKKKTDAAKKKKAARAKIKAVVKLNKIAKADAAKKKKADAAKKKKAARKKWAKIKAAQRLKASQRLKVFNQRKVLLKTYNKKEKGHLIKIRNFVGGLLLTGVPVGLAIACGL